MNRSGKKPLYRKVNTKARGVRHRSGGNYRDVRRAKGPIAVGMSQGVRRGLDYTPLFKFLLSKAGTPWDAVHREAAARLDQQEPIFWLVSLGRENARDLVRVGPSTYYSGLFVDEEGILRLVAPDIGPQDLEPGCGCCTHTLNGKPFTKKFRPAEE